MNPGERKSRPHDLAHTSAIIAEAVEFFFRTPNSTASNFAELLPTDPLLPVWKDPKTYLNVLGVHKADSILRICFAHSE